MQQERLDATGEVGQPGLGAAFWRMWVAGIVDNIGDGALTIGVGLLAAMVTSDPRLVALVSAAGTLPWLIVSLPAGVLVDRVDRVRAMRSALVLQAGAMALLSALTAVGLTGIPALAGLAFVVTTGDVVFNIASQSALPQLVEKRLLVRANSLNYTGQNVGYSFVGQPLGGLLFATSSALPFVLETASYVTSAGLLAGLPRMPRPARAGGEHSPGVAADTLEGLRWLGRNRLLRTLALVLGANTLANQAAMSMLVLFALHSLHVSHAWYGLMVGSFALGGSLGGLVNSPLVRRLGAARALILALTTNAVCYAAVGFTTNAIQVAALLAVVGFSVTGWTVISVSLRQSLIPDHLLGRVNSAYRMLGWGMMPLGALLGGLLAGWFGLRVPFLAAGGLRLLALLLALPVLLALPRGARLSLEGEPTGRGRR